MKLKVSLFILLAVASASCVDIPDFDDTPWIDYNGISQETRIDTVNGAPQGETEVVTITVDFTDGDGDLGATNAEVQDTVGFTKQYKKAPNWNLEANYELVTMIKRKDGSWSETIMSGDSFKFFPRLKLDGKAGPIKGKLDFNARFLKSRSTVPTTVKFKVRIIDRAFRVSNQEETDTIVVPLLP
ncbi:hypothetical protein SAMN05216327_106241 [Dyadobacter sp. SG02]|uniref:hypothetical protein n=1 Tax=Dyadobacter sp. SG02 TaxID=1855291 RepID=UPI0008B8EC85|nr:hypothetical protein [Dyadobacter sp. SG02]SEJ13141.1 hypothetical protein SAMN05216327_106241 [Dyadobacter sp. SG02]